MKIRPIFRNSVWQIVLLSLCTCTGLRAQTDYWTWIKGSNAINVLGVYGTLGTPATTNQPGGRYDPASWTDASGNFWMFGGWGYGATTTTSTYDGGAGFLNDLWKYTISTNEWTWMGGSNAAGAADTYGTQNVANAANTPGARYGSATWMDASGNLWLFGGASGVDDGATALGNITNHYNDLWEYNMTSGEWIWIGGSQADNVYGVYGTKGTGAATNLPGGRFNSAAWTDASGNFWLFGGGGMPATGQSTTYGYLNDLWKYNYAAGTWTWENGGDGVAAVGTYGALGAAAAGNTPGGRYAASGIIDPSGNLWLFGGASGTTYSAENLFYEDLWKYNPATNEWTWMDGDSETAEAGVYGTEGTAAAANHPGGRAAPANWRTTVAGAIVIFGGVGEDVNTHLGELSDLWAYNIPTGEWTWLSGPDTYEVDGVYGTMGVAAATNNPGARYSLGNWVDTKGDLWLFGGHGYPATGTTVGFLEDLWEFQPLSVLSVNLLSFTAAPSGNGGTANGGASPSNSAMLNWQMAEASPGGYFVVQRNPDGGNSWQSIGTVDVAVDALSGSYQFMDSKPLSGMNYYRLKMMYTGGDSSFSTVAVVDFGAGGQTALSIYPNPVTDVLHVAVSEARSIGGSSAIAGASAAGNINILMMNTRGQIVRTITASAGGTTNIPVTGLATGVYFVEILSGNARYVYKVVKE